MDTEIQNLRPNYKRIYTDILNEKFPEKTSKYKDFLNKEKLSSLDIILLNNKIFEKDKVNQSIGYKKHISYSQADILEMLDFQKKFNLNNSQLSKHFKISRNSVAKWKKQFL